MINLLLVDDHPVVLNGTKMLFQDIDSFHIETEQHSENVLHRMQNTFYQLFLIDINMEPINGIQLAEQIKKQQPDALVILYTGLKLTDYYELLLEKKIDGLLSKTATKEQVTQTIFAILRGELLVPVDFLDFVLRQFPNQVPKLEARLTDFEHSILQLVASGFTNKAIAAKLKITQRNVECHLSKLFVRLNVESRAEVQLYAKERGWIQ